MIMNKQTLRWLRAWSALAAVIVVAILLSRRYHFGFVAELVIYTCVALALVWARSVRKRSPPETRAIVDRRRIGPIQKYLIPGGAIAFCAGILWIPIFANAVPNSNLGAALLFGPSFGLIVVGSVAIGFRFYIWIVAD
jgi:hypothetical protein